MSVIINVKNGSYPGLGAFAVLFLFFSQPTSAACTTYSPLSGQTVTCDTGAPNPDTGAVSAANVSGVTVNTASGSILSPASGPGVSFSGSGSNTLINNGTINASSGNVVVFGNGNDTLQMNDGTLRGDIDQGGGADRAIIRGGTITGTLEQGNGIDDFVMSGGTLGSLAQGDAHDTFTMTGGTISGAFIDGDVAHMSGGTIGRVDMKLDNNLFDMSGGRIIGNLVTGFGNDTIIISDGSIGGNISVSGGTDSVTVSGGTVGGEIRLSTGNDSFLWQNGGLISGAVLMGEDNDSAVLRNLSVATLASTPNLDGGNGNDTLLLDNSSLSNPQRLTGWEVMNLTNGSSLITSSPLILGDSGSQTGSLNIDSSSTLLAGGLGASSIRASNAASLVTVNNAGTLDLTNGGDSPADMLTINGNYVGQNGLLKLQTVLGDENSASDRLAISGGAASGSTQIQLSNAGGEGAYTAGNGIELVSAINGATTSASAFSLQGGSISAGAYEYVLFHGGATAGSENNWYLRNTLIAPQTLASVPADPGTPEQPGEPGAPEQPGTPGQPGTPAQPGEPAAASAVPVAAPGSPLLPVAQVGADPLPLYRQETPLYSALPPVIFDLGISALSTFHQRQGSQLLLDEDGNFPASWGRVYGQHHDQRWSGDTGSSFDGNLSGVQVGQDLYARRYENGQRDHAGLFYNYSRVDGDIDGSVLGFAGAYAGQLKLNSNSLGAYWTHLWANQAYVDAVVMHSWLDGTLRSGRGMGGDTRGRLISGSLEGGYPLALSTRWSLEPQAQIIGQRLMMDDLNDGIARIAWGNDTRYSGRLGARLQGNYGVVEPYLKANIWHDVNHTGTVKMDQDALSTAYGSTALEVGVGVAARLGSQVSLYAAASHTNDLDSNHRSDYSGNIGARIRW